MACHKNSPLRHLDRPSLCGQHKLGRSTMPQGSCLFQKMQETSSCQQISCAAGRKIFLFECPAKLVHCGLALENVPDPLLGLHTAAVYDVGICRVSHDCEKTLTQSVIQRQSGIQSVFQRFQAQNCSGETGFCLAASAGNAVFCGRF